MQHFFISYVFFGRGPRLAHNKLLWFDSRQSGSLLANVSCVLFVGQCFLCVLCRGQWTTNSLLCVFRPRSVPRAHGKQRKSGSGCRYVLLGMLDLTVFVVYPNLKYWKVELLPTLLRGILYNFHVLDNNMGLKPIKPN
jgi:hypothetical protein